VYNFIQFFAKLQIKLKFIDFLLNSLLIFYHNDDLLMVNVLMR